MKNLINWLLNSKHSEAIGSIFIGTGYIALFIGAFLFYINVRGG